MSEVPSSSETNNPAAQPSGRNVVISGDAVGNTIITGDGNRIEIYPASPEPEPEPEAPAPELGQNPYRGLNAFTEEDTQLFFGREVLLEKLEQQFRRLILPTHTKARLLPIVGPSGSGKSSLVRAGLVPKLATDAGPDQPAHRIETFQPGDNPLQSLAMVLAKMATGDPLPAAKAVEVYQLLITPDEAGQFDGLARMVCGLDGLEQTPVTFLIDQFEELYSLCDAADQRHAFIENLLYAGSQKSNRVSVIITLRSDFLEKTQSHAGMNGLIQEHALLVLAMTRDELTRAIIKPAQQAGYSFDKATVQLLLNQTQDPGGALPLLQFTLFLIWEGLGQGQNPIDTLTACNGVGGALAEKAESIYAELNPNMQSIARRVFVSMVHLGDHTRNTRRRVRVQDLVNSSHSLAQVEAVVQLFAAPSVRLVSLSSSSHDRLPQAELTHEILIEQWERLGHWLQEDREDENFQRKLQQAAVLWSEDRVTGRLWRSPDLDQLRNFAARNGEILTPLQFQFFKACELARKMAAFLAFAISLAFVSVIIIVLLLVNRQRLQAEAGILEGNYFMAKVFEQKAAAHLAQGGSQDYEKAWLYTLEALSMDIPKDKSLPVSMGRVLSPDLSRDAFRNLWTSSQLSGINAFAVHPGGNLLATAGHDGSILIWDLRTGQVIGTMPRRLDVVNSLAFSPDGSELVSGSDRGIQLWDMATYEEKGNHMASHFGQGITFSPNGDRLISTSTGDFIQLWDAATLNEISPQTKGPETYAGAVFSPDGSSIASTSDDNKILLWDAKTLQIFASLSGHSNIISYLAFSPDGGILASVSEDRTIRLWDVEARKDTLVLSFDFGWAGPVAFSPDGKYLASESFGSRIRLWDVTSGEHTATLDYFGDESKQLAFLPDGDLLVLARRGTVHVWDMTESKQRALISARDSGVRDVAISPDGNLLASAGWGIIRVWDTNTQLQLARFANPPHFNKRIRFSPDGKLLAFTTGSKGVVLWHVGAGNEPITLRGNYGRYLDVVFSADGSRLVCASAAGTISFWDVASLQEIARFSAHSDAVTSLAFAPDGSRLASGSDDRTVRIWDAATQTLLTTLAKNEDSVQSLAFSPDSNQLVSAAGNSIDLWDLQTHQKRSFRGHSNRVSRVVFSPNSRYLASASDDSTIRLWDMRTEKQLSRLSGHSDMVHGIAFTPDGTRLASASSDNTVRLWDIEVPRQVIDLPRNDYPLVFSPGGKRFAMPNGSNIELRDTATQILEAVLQGHSSVVVQVAYSPDGTRLASAAIDSTIRLWDLKKAEVTVVLEDPNIKKIAFTDDGTGLISVSWDSTVRLWDTAAEEPPAILFEKEDGIGSETGFSPNLTHLAHLADDGTIQVWDLIAGEQLSALQGLDSKVSAWNFSPDRALLLTRSLDQTLRLWDVANQKQLAIISKQSGHFYDIAFSPDSKLIAFSLEESTIRLWDVAAQQETALFIGHGEIILDLLFSPDGKFLFSKSGDKTMRLWDVATQTEIARLPFPAVRDAGTAFSPDGRWLAIEFEAGTLGILDLQRLAAKQDWAKIRRLSYQYLPHQMDTLNLVPKTPSLYMTPMNGYTFPQASPQDINTNRPKTGDIFDWASSDNP